MPDDTMQNIRKHLKTLKLNRMEKALDETLALAAKQNLAPAAVLERLLDIEAASLVERRIERRIRESKLPERKLLADFDFKFQAGIDQRQVMELATLDFVERKQWLILAGGSGTGKSHVAKALLLLACQRLYRCRYTTASFMLRDLLSGLADDSIETLLAAEKIPRTPLLVGLAKSAFLSVVAALAMWELDLAREIVLAAFLIGFGAIGVAFALGVGIGSARAIQEALTAVIASRRDD